MTSDLRPFETRIEFSIKTYDIDFADIVSNIVYIRWLEDLRLKLLEDHWPLEMQMRDGYLPVLLSTRIEYIRALRLFDRPLGTMWLTDLGKVRFALGAEFTVDGRVSARAEHICAFVNSETLRPLPIPAGLRERFVAARGE